MWHYWIHPGRCWGKLCPGWLDLVTWRQDALWTLPNPWWNLTLRENLDPLYHEVLFTLHLLSKYLAISDSPPARRISDAIQYKNPWQSIKMHVHGWNKLMKSTGTAFKERQRSQDKCLREGQRGTGVAVIEFQRPFPGTWLPNTLWVLPPGVLLYRGTGETPLSGEYSGNKCP